MQASHALGSAHDDQCPPAGGRAGGLQFPPFPGEHPLQHEAQIWLEIAEALASAGLLIVANGGAPARPRGTSWTFPSTGSRRCRLTTATIFERRIETRIRIETENRKNAARRYHKSAHRPP
ncbi:hypothetical protein AB1Y20_023322 [Prymnesium parvum]|uniref:Uncharacterized protein n=1 Tax=Prymnesium parvum TaxID=97485 RepID=A0AB34JDP2_PRYPA